MDRRGYHCDRRLSVGTFIVFEWVSPTGDYLLSGLLRFALRAFACKSWACRSWQARSPGQASTGRLAVSGSPTPVPRVPFFACPKKGTERKGTPDSAPANPAGPLARSLPQWVRARDLRVPGPAASRASAAGTGASRIIGGDPVNPRPGERAHHGRCAPGFRVKQGKRERRKALRRTP